MQGPLTTDFASVPAKTAADVTRQSVRQYAYGPDSPEALRMEAKRRLLKNLLIAAGLGVGTRTAFGVRDWLAEGNEEKDASEVEKDAMDPGTVALVAALGALTAGGTYAGIRAAKKSFEQSEPHHVPWYMGATALGVPLAYYGGHRTADYLFDKAKRSKLTSEVDEARKEYEAALAAEQLAAGPASIAKTGSAVDLVAERLANKYVEDPEMLTKEGKGGMGATALAAIVALQGLIGSGSWLLTKHYMDKADENRRQLEALRSVQKARAMNPLYSKGLTLEELLPGALAARKRSKRLKPPEKTEEPTRLPRSL